MLPEVDAIAGRTAVRRAGRGEEYDPMTGKLQMKGGKARVFSMGWKKKKHAARKATSPVTTIHANHEDGGAGMLGASDRTS